MGKGGWTFSCAECCLGAWRRLLVGGEDVVPTVDSHRVYLELAPTSTSTTLCIVNHNNSVSMDMQRIWSNSRNEQ